MLIAALLLYYAATMCGLSTAQQYLLLPEEQEVKNPLPEGQETFWKHDGATPSTSKFLTVFPRAEEDGDLMDDDATTSNGFADAFASSQKLIYQMDVMHFTKYDPRTGRRSQIQQATDQLRRLREDLSITTVWVMPPYSRYADGPYATKNYFQIDPRLGSNDDFRRFVETAHTLGLEVILDLTTVGHGCGVLKVKGKEMEGKSSCDNASTGWAVTGADPERIKDLSEEAKRVVLPLPVDCPFMDLCVLNWNDVGGVTDYFAKIFSHWVTEFGVDGYRCDTAETFSGEKWTHSRNDRG